MSEWNLRCADEQDIELLFQWANDDAVRNNSFSQQSILWEEHVAWFQNAMEDPNVILYIGEIDGTPVGQIRITIADSEGTISYSVAEGYRCLGYGKQLLISAAQRIKVDFPNVRTLVGEVKPENVASQVAFENAGFTEHHRAYCLQLEDFNKSTSEMPRLESSGGGGYYVRSCFLRITVIRWNCIGGFLKEPTHRFIATGYG